ncbi:2Fe-2S iron-sulfur cluster binding domain-containing protein [Roseovarius sp. SCSIO 43702]|uniref:2Fe-2S iron-sulfur cluster-binding protein n=1 Tax=Roseovarius sp. SCSIO 43702 TaxID=2823043 RepID=UPI001C736DBD|nr:2Fe-2S iron-sulfur cluster-binding protein [Roseovarius sp. SCSIO 43702]QYX56227.1 2Fe-2S iron-sulfur cluster binding domain-containing protein [Roseovarius sp. SCSIO 43702]
MADGFRTFRVADKRRESDIITSFHLVPVDGGALWPVRPGQYLTLKMPGEGAPVLKTYSVSNAAAETEHHRITVKREAGQNGAPDGLGSCWLHDRIEVGDEIEIAPPRGHFVLNEESRRPVMLLSGGVGLTPLVSMLHSLEGTGRDVYFIHACENGAVHALRDEVTVLADEHIRTLFVYRAPGEADRSAGAFHAEGMIDKAFLQSHLPLGDYEVYLCGPAPFMAAMYQLLRELGLPKDRIAYEFFGKATSLDKLAEAPAPARAPARNAAPAIRSLVNLTDPDAWATEETVVEVAEQPSPEVAQADVRFRRSGVSEQWDGAADSLLELAENAGLNPEFSCRAGICNSCKCGLVSGEVEYFEEPLSPPEAGKVLICCARPKGPVVLDI